VNFRYIIVILIIPLKELIFLYSFAFHFFNKGLAAVRVHRKSDRGNSPIFAFRFYVQWRNRRSLKERRRQGVMVIGLCWFLSLHHFGFLVLLLFFISRTTRTFFIHFSYREFAPYSQPFSLPLLLPPSRLSLPFQPSPSNSLAFPLLLPQLL